MPLSAWFAFQMQIELETKKLTKKKKKPTIGWALTDTLPIVYASWSSMPARREPDIYFLPLLIAVAMFVPVDDRWGACGWDQGGWLGLQRLLGRANFISAPCGRDQATGWDWVGWDQVRVAVCQAGPVSSARVFFMGNIPGKL